MAKSEAWKDLIATIENNPWALPYKIVLNKLRSFSTDVMHTIKHEAIQELIDDVFSNKEEDLDYNFNFQWNTEDEVTPGEVFRTMKKRQITNTAPGPDGVKTTVFKKVPGCLLDKIQKCFTNCLRKGIFPTQWKIANLVLIPKGENRMGVAPKVRPICLLDNIGKAFERILVERMLHWMDDHPIAQFSRNQYGFRKQKSTLDAIQQVVDETQNSRDGDGVTIAVCLDIRNAFNSLPWRAIKEALKRKGFPEYLRRILDSYFSNRWIN